MLASSALVLSGLLAVAQGALMPRVSPTAAPGCFRCLPSGGNRGSGTVLDNGNLYCIYPAGSPVTQCAYDGTTGALTVEGSATDCGLAGLATAAPAAFQCPSAIGQGDLSWNSVDPTTGDTTCVYYINANIVCVYTPVGLLYDSSDGCPDAAPLCGSTSRRSYKADNNFTAIKRKQAARAVAPVKL